MIGHMLDLVARAWAWVRAEERANRKAYNHLEHLMRPDPECRVCQPAAAPGRVVPEGITVEEPTDEDRTVYALAAQQRQQAAPGRIVVASEVSLYDTDRFERCRQCERQLAMAGDWPAHVFVVCRECAHGMQHLEAMVENRAASEAHERAFRERRAVPAVVRRH